MKRLGMVAVVILMAGCGGRSAKTSGGVPPTPARTESAGDALTRQLGFIEKGQWGRNWDELHPAQQAIISRDHYQECAQRAGHVFNITNVKVLETYDEPTDIPGTTLHAPSTAVTVELTVDQPGQAKTQKTTLHEFLVDGRWRWTVAAAEQYAGSTCPP